MFRSKKLPPKQGSTHGVAPVNIARMLTAARIHDWDAVNKLLNEGYSLLWADPVTHKSLVRTLAEEGNDIAVMKILNMSKEEHSNSSLDNTFPFIFSEAVIGAKIFEQNPLLLQIEQHFPSELHSLNKCIVLAKYEKGEFDIISLERSADPATLKTALRHIARGKRSKDAIHLLKHHVDILLQDLAYHEKTNFDNLINDLVISVVEGAIQNPDIDFKKYLDDCTKALTRQEDRTALLYHENPELKYVCQVLRAAMIAAAKHDNSAEYIHALTQYHHLRKNDMDDPVQQSIYAAMQGGHPSVLHEILKYARQFQVDINLTDAAGCALANEHYALFQYLIQLSPAFSITPEDNAKLCRWSRDKIARAFHSINNPPVFYEIAAKIKHPDWLALLKSKYRLSDMSDDGFHKLVNHPEVIPIIIKCTSPTMIIPRDIIKMIIKLIPNLGISENDINIFMQAYARAKEDKLSGNKTTLFRLRSLLISPATYHCHLAIKRQIMTLLEDYLSQKHLHKDAVSQLCTEINSANNIEKIHSTLQKHLSLAKKEWLNGPHVTLLNQCVAVFNTFKNHPEVRSVMKVV